VKAGLSIKIDATDTAILELLRQNGRMSNREVGRALDISEGTVRQRLRKMVEGGAMRLGVVTDIHTAGQAVGVTVRIKALPARIATSPRRSVWNLVTSGPIFRRAAVLWEVFAQVLDS
jgi:DNA-binding Lrp family transcriptional regulator